MTVELPVWAACAERNDNVVLTLSLSETLRPPVHVCGVLLDHGIQVVHGLLLQRVQVAVVDQVALVLKFVPEILVSLVLDNGSLLKSFFKHLSHCCLFRHSRYR